VQTQNVSTKKAASKNCVRKSLALNVGEIDHSMESSSDFDCDVTSFIDILKAFSARKQLALNMISALAVLQHSPQLTCHFLFVAAINKSIVTPFHLSKYHGFGG